MTLDVAELLGGTVRRLSFVDRYAALRTARRENVAEHSFFVALVAMAIARDLRRLGIEIDELRIVSGALCHDLSEAVGGDLPRPYLSSVPRLKSLVTEVHERFAIGIGRKLGVDVDRDWNVHLCDDLEGRIVALADLLEVVAYVGEEVRGGNGHLRGVAREVVSGLVRAVDAFPATLSRYILEAQEWLERIESERVPGDVERVLEILEER
jgi:5'-deoxynucleotidase YfbR-like HD superfamily hydrolase